MKPIRDAQGHIEATRSMLADITNRKRAENALEKLEEKTGQLQAITEAMMGFLESGNLREASTLILYHALKQTKSEYGFVAVVLDGPTCAS